MALQSGPTALIGAFFVLFSTGSPPVGLGADCGCEFDEEVDADGLYPQER
ncbi:hypothetical protein [Azospirillum melinis]